MLTEYTLPLLGISAGVFVHGHTLFHPDVFGHPQYNVTFSPHALPISQVPAFHGEPSPDAVGIINAGKESWWPAGVPTNGDFIPYRAQDGRKFICVHPKEEGEEGKEEGGASSHAPDTPLDTPQVSLAKEEETALLDKGLTTLEPLIGHCLQFVDGWWTYEYCHRQYIRQYHIPAHPGEQAFDVYLGQIHGSAATHDEPSDPIADTALIMGSDPFRGDRRLILHRYSGGTVCEVTGRPRTIEVEIRCSPVGDERITAVLEVATCMYRMIIQTHRLCTDPHFTGAAYSPVKQLPCFGVLEEDEYAEWLKSEAEAKAKAKAAAATSPVSPPTLDGPETGDIDPRGAGLKFQMDKGKTVDTPPSADAEPAEDLSSIDRIMKMFMGTGKVKGEGKAATEGDTSKDQTDTKTDVKTDVKEKTKPKPKDLTMEELDAMSPEELKQMILQQQEETRAQKAKQPPTDPSFKPDQIIKIDIADLLGIPKLGASKEEKEAAEAQRKEQDRIMQELLASVKESISKPRRTRSPEASKETEEAAEEELARDEL